MHNMYFYLHSYCHFKYKPHDAKKRNASLFHFSILFKLFFYNLCSSPYSFVFRIGKQIENKYEEKRSSMSIHNTPTITTGFFPCHPVLHIHSSFEPPLQCSSLPPLFPQPATPSLIRWASGRTRQMSEARESDLKKGKRSQRLCYWRQRWDPGWDVLLPVACRMSQRRGSWRRQPQPSKS